MSRNFLTTGDELRKGDFLMSNNKEYKAIFQHDGNFVIYGWKPIWASDTWQCQGAHRLLMQEDCNFVMYTSDDTPVWATASNATGCTRNRVFLRDDGVLQIDNNGVEVWTSNKTCK